VTVTDLRLGEQNKQCADRREVGNMNARWRAWGAEETTGGKETGQASYLCNVSIAGRILSEVEPVGKELRYVVDHALFNASTGARRYIKYIKCRM